MKSSYRLISIVSILLLAVLPLLGQQPAPVTDPFIKGDLIITYNTRTQKDGDKPKAGVKDDYKLKINVANSIMFDGTIQHQPFIKNTFGSNQPGRLIHSVDCFVYNPRNLQQTKNIGRLYGAVPIDEQNVYRFEDGDLRIGIFGSGGAQGIESRVKGLALGKPPAASGWAKMFNQVKERISITKSVGGQAVTIQVNNYDQMVFQNHVLSAGPLGIYTEVTVAGTMLYDYDRSAWHFQGLTITYGQQDERGRVLIQSDRLTGNIRWVEAPDRKTSGKGEYQFDVRVNEPQQAEAAMFMGSAQQAEDAFFTADATIPGLTGTMAYTDSIVNDVVTRSTVKIDLKGGQLSKQQAVYLAKLLMMSCIVPFNAE